MTAALSGEQTERPVAIRPKTIFFTVAAIFWLALLLSDYAVLTGRRSLSYNGYANVRCSYWTGMGKRRLRLFGRIGSEALNCPNVLTNVEKW